MKTTALIILALGVLALIPVTRAAEKGATPAVISRGAKITLTENLVAGKITVFDFYSKYSPPCVRFTPVLDMLHANRADVAVVKVDINRPDQKGIDLESPVSRQFNLNSIPHLKIYGVDGKLMNEGSNATKWIIEALGGAIIDLRMALNWYSRTEEEAAKLRAFEREANKKAEAIVAEGRALAQKFQAAQAIYDNPATKKTAKKQAQDDAKKLYQNIQEKEKELNNFRQQAVAEIQQRVAQTRKELLSEIVAKAIEVGKARGATMIFDSADGEIVHIDLSRQGIPSDTNRPQAMDITNEVSVALNKDHSK